MDRCATAQLYQLRATLLRHLAWPHSTLDTAKLNGVRSHRASPAQRLRHCKTLRTALAPTHYFAQRICANAQLFLEPLRHCESLHNAAHHRATSVRDRATRNSAQLRATPLRQCATARNTLGPKRKRAHRLCATAQNRAVPVRYNVSTRNSRAITQIRRMPLRLRSFPCDAFAP